MRQAATDENGPHASKPTSLDEFGVRGDGLADDTDALQRALDSDAPYLASRPNARYRVSARLSSLYPTPENGSRRFPVCMLIGSNKRVDFAGSSIFQSEERQAILMSNRGIGHGGSDAITLENLIFDGLGRQSQQPLVWFQDIANSRFLRLKISRSTYCGIFVANARESRFADIRIERCIGQGAIFGGNTWERISRCTFSGLSADDVKFLANPHQPGNPFLFGAEDCVIDDISAANSAGGVKITANSRGLYIKSVRVTGGTSSNSGFKVQGDTQSPCLNVRVDQAFCSDCFGSGLFLSHASGISIGSYSGANNGRGLKDPDVWIDADKVEIGMLMSVRPGQKALEVRQSAGSFSIGKAVIVDPRRLPTGNILALEGGVGSIGFLTVNGVAVRAAKEGSNISS